MPHTHDIPPDMSPSSSTTLALMNVCLADRRATLLGRHNVSFFCKLLNEPTACSQDVALIVFSEIFQTMVRKPPPWPLALPAMLLILWLWRPVLAASGPCHLDPQRARFT